MSDLVTMARAARERLAQALSVLQDPTVPADLLAVAEPIARAMTLLHEVEHAPGHQVPEISAQALMAVRRALSSLQVEAARHPAAAYGVEAVAGALNLAHQLSTLPLGRPATPALAGTSHGMPLPAAPAPPAPLRPSAPAFGAFRPASPAPVPAESPAQHQASRAAYVEPAAAFPLHHARDAAGAHAPPPAQSPAPPGAANAAPALLTPQQQRVGGPPSAFGMAATEPVREGLGGPYRPPNAPPPAPPDALLRVAAEMGAHSPTNFYKGLSGADVVDAGGVFIATYQIPSIGRHVLIDFSMPGGYEFRAKGVVRWTRESPGSTDAPPGFGAQITEIPPEGRHLVRRYVKNRDPLFFDDP